jgi:vanillate/4-hydroxybenzoate decarboxylase subunit D
MNPRNGDARPVCPRCRSTTTEVRSTSPISGAWTVFGCSTCFYCWRSTEPAENTKPDQYPAIFRLKPEQLASLPVIPNIPALRLRAGR